ncbi:hypothetical protein X798_01383 [Onchocerca flexuosa]|uniref:DUF5076 domain-containing protein n=2 Tax=Onchocerca flexuosa TaxID=387005 RepID=A0A183I1N0_9BILA|nr:hypothetical protein X798_01383 [Onchocerca flexuosa]VDP14275.1 unnamed protein product [Onchocerca flexuosa]
MEEIITVMCRSVLPLMAGQFPIEVEGGCEISCFSDGRGKCEVSQFVREVLSIFDGWGKHIISGTVQSKLSLSLVKESFHFAGRNHGIEKGD